MKKISTKKWMLTALWTVMLSALSAVTVYADVAPEPEPLRSELSPLTALIAALVLIAAAVIAWVVIRNGKKRR